MEKMYYVTTRDLVNRHLLHHSMSREYATSNIDDARRVYSDEINHLSTEDQSDRVSFDFVEEQPTATVICEITEIPVDNPDEVNVIESSKYFYIPE